MLTRHTFGTSNDLTERQVYRFWHTSGMVTLVTKRRGVVYVMGFGNGTKYKMSCDQWDAAYVGD